MGGLLLGEMMEANFTRGPWTMNDFGEICGSDGKQILVSGVSVPCGNHSRAEEARANGRLFFAALAMYEALEAVEWEGDTSWDEARKTFVGTCPDCGASKYTRHHSACRINIALRAVRGEV